MTKLYYDDPLIAAYMGREFGVEFENEDETATFVMEGGAEYATLSQIQQCVLHHKYYIHPDSYHIFEPRGDDIGIADGILCHYYKSYKEWIGTDDLETAFCTAEIIMRDGKHFMMPSVFAEATPRQEKEN